MQKFSDSPWAFVALFVLVFFLSSSFLYLIDFVPEAPKNQTTETTLNETISVGAEAPVRIRIPKVGVDTPIQNPQSVDLEVLDSALLSGAVRYPGTALLGQSATMFLFGHQSYLPVVHNQAFKAFNGLQELKKGDSIFVSSNTSEHEYRVISVSKVRADEALIELEQGEKKLILSTCNSFGDPGERFVVEAEYVGISQS